MPGMIFLPTLLVELQCAEGRTVQGQASGPSEFGVSDRQPSRSPVHILLLQAQRFANAKPSAGQQSDERLKAQAAQSAQLAGSLHQSLDLLWRIEVNGSSTVRRPQEPRRGQLRSRIEGSPKTGKAPCDIQAPGPPKPTGAHRGLSPGQCQLGCQWA